MASQDDLARFIAASFRSVWSLELLLLLKREGGLHTREELIRALRGSELVVAQALEGLVGAGLAVVDENGSASYLPISAEVGQLVDQAEDLYSRRPDAVRRTIVAAATPGLTAFADAFRLRRD
jgi:hypothetical protein